jgi:hypothetical protein
MTGVAKKNGRDIITGLSECVAGSPDGFRQRNANYDLVIFGDGGTGAVSA